MNDGPKLYMVRGGLKFAWLPSEGRAGVRQERVRMLVAEESGE